MHDCWIYFLHMTAKISRHTINQLPVIVHEDETKGYWVECPALEGCYSQGDTIDEALKNIHEAIKLCLVDVSSRTFGKAHQGCRYVKGGIS